jgi:hypothetical protein
MQAVRYPAVSLLGAAGLERPAAADVGNVFRSGRHARIELFIHSCP